MRDATVVAAVEVVPSCAIRTDSSGSGGVVITGDALGNQRAVNNASHVVGVAGVAGAAGRSVTADLAETDAIGADTGSVGRVVVGAVESGLDRAGGRAPVSCVEVAIVAAFGRHANAIPASRDASVSRHSVSGLAGEADSGVAGEVVLAGGAVCHNQAVQCA